MGQTTSFPIVKLPKDRVVVVTGSNTGLGYQIAKWTAMMGATVILACRSEERARAAIDQMNEEFKAEKSKGTLDLADYDSLALEFMKVDLASFRSTTEFCDDFKKSGKPLHVLFCNAGLGLRPYLKTEDGYEICLQVNYLSHFIMIAKLLPVMKRSGDDCRLLMMTSYQPDWCRFDRKTMNYEGSPENYPQMVYYFKSKLYLIMQMFCMVRRKSAGNVTVNCVCPGIVETEFYRDFQPPCCCMRPLCPQKPLDGARCSIDCTVNPKYAGVTGLYFCRFYTLPPSRKSRDVSKQELLWATTMDIVRQHLTKDEIAGMEGKLNGLA